MRPGANRRLDPFVFFLLAMLTWQIGAVAQAQPKVLPAPTPKRVLLLYTYGDGLPAYEKATPAFISVMTAGGINTNDLFFEYLDLQRNDNAEYRRRLADLLRYKYAKHQIELIVTVHTEALNFLLNEGKGLFPDAPVFSYLIVRPELIEVSNTRRRILQRPQNLDMKGTLEIALKMFPETQKIVFVTGTATGDRRFEHEAKQTFEPWRNKLEFQYTSDLSVEEILQLVGNLPPRSVVIYSNVFSDRTGRTFTPLEVGKMVAKAANSPVFCLWDTLIGTGVIGGSLLSFGVEGAYAANVVLDILNGKIVLTKPVTTLTPSKTFIFNSQQLTRWGVNESILPKGSVLVNRVPTLWEQHKWLVIGSIGVFLAQTLLVIGLLIQRNLKRKAEDSLLQKTEELDQFFNVSLDVLCIANTDGYFLRLNPAVERILGYTREELMSKRFFEFVHPDDLDRTRGAVSTLGSQQKVFLFENRYRCKDGTYRWLEWSSAPVGNMIYAAARDVTEHKRAEEALRHSEERFRQVAENVGDFIWEVDANGLYRYTSPSVEKILGYRPDELVGKRHFYDLFAPEIREELKAAAFKVFAAKESFRALPNPNLSKEGKVVYLETSGGPMLEETGNLVGYRGADTDVTERRRAQEELRRHQEHLEESVRERTAELVMARDEAEVANRAKSTFLANMSHELRTPLNSILGIAQLMERDAGFPDQQRDTLKILSRSGTHLLELINDVLELSKIEAGKMTSDITSFDLHSFLGDLEEMIRLRAEGKGLNLLFEYKSSLPQHIETDLRKLRQILINLLGNAIKYTETGGVILRTRFKEGMGTTPWGMPSSLGRLEFEIEDTGIGIAPEDMQRIFEPFVQVHPGRTVRDGTGLGLTLSRMFVELLGGEITIRSQVGKGSTFAFDIAVKLAEAAAVHTEEADRQVIGLMPGHPPYRLLVVDDSIENRFVLRRLLERVGFGVLDAASGQEALDLYKSGQPHLIWMDLRMPAMDGNEAARRIREAESGRRNEEGKEIHTPIIALTAGVMKGESPPSHSRIFDGLVYKPFRETEIFDELEKHLGVQFVCDSSVRSAVDVENTTETAVLTPASLSILPVNWLREFFQTLRKGRSAQLLKLIDQISPDHADLAGALAGLVRIHQFDKLIAVTEGTLKENSNG